MTARVIRQVSACPASCRRGGRRGGRRRPAGGGAREQFPAAGGPDAEFRDKAVLTGVSADIQPAR